MPGTTVNQLGVGLSSSIGTGSFVGSVSPTINSPTLSGAYALGTPASGNLSNCTNLVWGTYNSAGATLQLASGTVSAAQIKALHATPAPLIAAQGANTLIVVVAIYGYYVYGGTAYTAGSAQTIRLVYGTTQTILTTFFSNAILIGSASVITQNPGASNAGFPTTNFINQAVNFYNPVATEVTVGNSTINWCALYYVLTTP